MAGSDLMYELGEGNPGALSVLLKLDYNEMAKLKDMGITGSSIWIEFKDICKENIEKFRVHVDDGSIEAEVKATPDWKYQNEGRQR